MPALTYTQVPTVAAGDPVSAGDLCALGAGINDRLLGGAGDCHWRLAYLMFSLFRQLRKPDASGTLFPPQAEFFSIYQAIDPLDAEYPDQGAGDPEGANVSCQINSFVHGSEALDIASERGRIAQVPVDAASDAEGNPSASGLWQLAKAQRGAFDPNTGALASPMLELATGYRSLRQSEYSPHGNSWGGYLPGPADAGTCAGISDGDGGFFYPPDLQIFFTRISTGVAEKVYSGTCPENATDVAFVAYLPLAYVVVLNNGTAEYLPKSVWIEGPYTSEARLQKSENGMLARVVGEFAAEFRGTAEQRTESDGGVSKAFFTQRFLTSQYPLAPNVGVDRGDGTVAAKYPKWVARGSTALSHSTANPLTGPAGRRVTFPQGTVCTGALVTGTKIKQPFRVRLMSGTTVVKELRVVPSATGAVDVLVMLATPQRMNPMTVALGDTLVFGDTTGSLAVEATCLLEYQPRLDDFYAVVRRAAWNGEFFSPDGRGIDESAAREISDTLYDSGVVLPLSAGGVTAPVGLDAPTNQNAVFDAARELSKCVRILPRAQVVGYAVEDGKSILWLRRYAYGLHKGVPADLLAGIGPDLEPIACPECDAGREYEVVAGRAKSGGRLFGAGQTFTAAATVTGDATVRELEGIRAVAPKGKFTNRWCLDLTFKPYHPSLSSLWKPDAFADVVTPFLDRCTFDEPAIAVNDGGDLGDNLVLRHFNFGERPMFTPENPTGYRYVPTPASTYTPIANQITLGGSWTEEVRANFYRSCRIYEPPIEVESAERVVAADGEERVKLTLTGRLHHHHSLAPASVDEDITGWDTADLLAESVSYATLENRLRQYLVTQVIGGQCDATGPGNNAANSDIQSDPDNPYGSCYPTVLLTQLVPTPRLDANLTAETSDSPALSDHLRRAELYLRAFCEGFVDGRTSADMACAEDTTTLYDYSFPNLWFDAIGNRHLPLLPEDIRSDNPEGHGALPMTYKYAETFNGLARATNLLRTVRVMLPLTLQTNQVQWQRERDVTDEVKTAAGNQPPGTWTDGTSDWAVWMTTAGGSGGTETESGWVDGSTGSVTGSSNLSVSAPGAPTAATLIHTTQELQFRWNAENDIELAVPEGIRDYLSTAPEVLLRLESWTERVRRETVVGNSAGTQCSTSGPDTVWMDGTGNAILWTTDTSATTTTCRVFGGSLASGPSPGGLTWHSDAEPDVDGDEFCLGYPANITNATVIVADTPAITIPLVDYAGGT